MKNRNISHYFIFAIILLLPAVACNQNSDHLDSTNDLLMKAARDIMTAAKTCALITLDEEGRPAVRTMDPFLPEDDFTVWFGTNPKSRKVGQIKKDPRVTLYYVENNDAGYVMMHGIAQIVDDQEEKEKRWKSEWAAFYPNKFETYTLIKVIPEWMEVISYSHGILGDSITWETPKVDLK